MVTTRTKGETLFSLFNGFLMIFMMVICLYPMWHVLMASLSDGNWLLGHTGFLLWPGKLSLAAYGRVASNPMIYQGYGNTLFVVTLGVGLNLFMTSLGAYVLSRKGYKLKRFLNFMIIFTMFFSGGLIPLYLIVKGVGLLNNRFALILPMLINTYNMIIMRTNFQTIPESLEESARMDGAGDFTILFGIVLPLSKAVVAVMILYYGVHHWNDWFSAMIYLQDRTKYPLQLILREILLINSMDSMLDGEYDSEGISESIRYATIIVATAPILLVYPFIQKYFVKGMLIGALKG